MSEQSPAALLPHFWRYIDGKEVSNNGMEMGQSMNDSSMDEDDDAFPPPDFDAWIDMDNADEGHDSSLGNAPSLCLNEDDVTERPRKLAKVDFKEVSRATAELSILCHEPIQKLEVHCMQQFFCYFVLQGLATHHRKFTAQLLERLVFCFYLWVKVLT